MGIRDWFRRPQTGDLRSAAELVYNDDVARSQKGDTESYTLILNNKMEWHQEEQTWMVDANVLPGQRILLWTGRGGAILESATVTKNISGITWGIEFDPPKTKDTE